MLGFGIASLDADYGGRLELAQANGHVNNYRPATPYAMPAQRFRGVGAGRLVDVSDRSGAPGPSRAWPEVWRSATSTPTAVVKS